jgi:hypothetical protein
MTTVPQATAGRLLRTLAVQVGLEGSYTTPNGFLVVPAIFARTGVIDWGRGERENYSAEVLLSDEALRAWSAQVITDDHPTDWLTGQSVPVTSANARFFAVGWTQNARQVMALVDGVELPHLGGDLVIADQATIDAVRAGKRQLSIGAFVSRDVSDKKRTYDFEVSKVEPNHLAIVDRGQCGGSCAIALALHPAHDDRSETQRVAYRAASARRYNDRLAALAATQERDTMACTCGATHATEMETLRQQHAATLQAAQAQAAAANAQLETLRAQMSAQARTVLLAEARTVLGADYQAPAAEVQHVNLAIMSAVVGHVLPAMAAAAAGAAAAGNEHFVTAAYQAALASRAAAAPIQGQQRNMAADIGGAVAGAQAAAQQAAAPAVTLDGLLLNLTASQARVPGFSAPTHASVRGQ